MCLSVPPSSLALISLTGFLANLDPYPSLLNDSPAPDISLPAHPVLSPFALAFDFSASEVTWLGVPGILNTLLPSFTTEVNCRPCGYRRRLHLNPGYFASLAELSQVIQ
ncbi:hypothetical protein N7489_008911 [Penicillium chrysogenum]|uniref:Uncharacterized protein n=1 Tax=Penicillium chrysogenum TaxID=5076 RepID=A0ABQ8WYT4_PENCH|nr:uncharacterized protein N7489_008911 [Penicillium chrysogenum]KAJ5228203.1 hypothetical protein N7489_008911 [Penicillium chrysogenum]KAJ5284160.1 hypothetical protein N7505_002140 [Penicillium chrysogenum]